MLCLFFYFMNEVLGVRKVQWQGDKPVVVKIRDILYGIGDNKARKISI